MCVGRGGGAVLLALFLCFDHLHIQANSRTCLDTLAFSGQICHQVTSRGEGIIWGIEFVESPLPPPSEVGNGLGAMLRRSPCLQLFWPDSCKI